MIRCNSVYVQCCICVYIRESRRTDRRVAEVNLLDVAKENMIGVVYEILPLAVINSERAVAPGWHDLSG